MILLAGLAAVIHWRTRLLTWITQFDNGQPKIRESVGYARWKAFLAEHPELIDS